MADRLVQHTRKERTPGETRGQCIICWCGDGLEEGAEITCLAFFWNFKRLQGCRRCFTESSLTKCERDNSVGLLFLVFAALLFFEEYIPT